MINLKQVASISRSVSLSRRPIGFVEEVLGLDLDALIPTPGLSVPSIEGTATPDHLRALVTALDLPAEDAQLLDKNLEDIILRRREYFSPRLQDEMLNMMSGLANLINNFNLLKSDSGKEGLKEIFSNFASEARSDCGQNLNGQLSEAFHQVLFLALKIQSESEDAAVSSESASEKDTEILKLVTATTLTSELKRVLLEFSTLLPGFPSIDVHYRGFVMNVGAEAFGIKEALGAQNLDSDDLLRDTEIQTSAYKRAILDKLPGHTLLEAITHQVNNNPSVRSYVLGILWRKVEEWARKNPELAKEAGFELDADNDIRNQDAIQGYLMATDPEGLNGLITEKYEIDAKTGIAQEKTKITPHGVAWALLSLNIMSKPPPTPLPQDQKSYVVALQVGVLKKSDSEIAAMCCKIRPECLVKYIREERLVCNGQGMTKRYFSLLVLYKSGQIESLRKILEKIATAPETAREVFSLIETHPIQIQAHNARLTLVHPHEMAMLEGRDLLSLMADIDANELLIQYFKQASDLDSSKLDLGAFKTRLVTVLQRLSDKGHLATATQLLETYSGFLDPRAVSTERIIRSLAQTISLKEFSLEQVSSLMMTVRHMNNQPLEAELSNFFHTEALKVDNDILLDFLIANGFAKHAQSANPFQAAVSQNAKKCMQVIYSHGCRIRPALTASLLQETYAEALSQDCAEWVSYIITHFRTTLRDPNIIETIFSKNALRSATSVVHSLPLDTVEKEITKALLRQNIPLVTFISQIFKERNPERFSRYISSPLDGGPDTLLTVIAKRPLVLTVQEQLASRSVKTKERAELMSRKAKLENDYAQCAKIMFKGTKMAPGLTHFLSKIALTNGNYVAFKLLLLSLDLALQHKSIEEAVNDAFENVDREGLESLLLDDGTCPSSLIEYANFTALIKSFKMPKNEIKLYIREKCGFKDYPKTTQAKGHAFVAALAEAIPKTSLALTQKCTIISLSWIISQFSGTPSLQNALIQKFFSALVPTSLEPGTYSKPEATDYVLGVISADAIQSSKEALIDVYSAFDSINRKKFPFDMHALTSLYSSLLRPLSSGSAASVSDAAVVVISDMPDDATAIFSTGTLRSKARNPFSSGFSST